MKTSFIPFKKIDLFDETAKLKIEVEKVKVIQSRNKTVAHRAVMKCLERYPGLTEWKSPESALESVGYTLEEVGLDFLISHIHTIAGNIVARRILLSKILCYDERWDARDNLELFIAAKLIRVN